MRKKKKKKAKKFLKAKKKLKKKKNPQGSSWYNGRNMPKHISDNGKCKQTEFPIIRQRLSNQDKKG